MSENKKCNLCKEEKLLEEFPKKCDTKDGLSSRCKICCRKKCLEYDNNHRKELNEKNMKEL